MTKTNPWHSVNTDHPKVYHDNTACTEGNNIEDKYRRAGTDNRRRCHSCTDLAR